MRPVLVAVALLSSACMSYRSEATAECEDEGDQTVVDTETGHCLILFEAPRSWSSAQAWCQINASADLVTIAGPMKNHTVDFLADGRRVWLGATDAEVENTWRWVDGHAMAYQNWSAGQPDNIGPMDDEDCLEMNYAAAGTWNDAECATAKAFVCERSARVPDR